MDILDAIGNTSLARLRKVVPPDCGDVLVKLEQIKFVNEPLPAATANTPARTTATNPAPTTTATDNRAASNTAATRSARSANEKWYPDHAVMNATKDQLKAMPAFKYSDYN